MQYPVPLEADAIVASFECIELFDEQCKAVLLRGAVWHINHSIIFDISYTVIC